MPASAMPKLVLLCQIPATHKKFTFKTTRETCPATMAQIQQNIILKKCMWLTLGEIARILNLLNTMPNHSLSKKVARQYRPSQCILKTADGTRQTPPSRATFLCALCVMLGHRRQIIRRRFALQISASVRTMLKNRVIRKETCIGHKNQTRFRSAIIGKI